MSIRSINFELAALVVIEKFLWCLSLLVALFCLLPIFFFLILVGINDCVYDRKQKLKAKQHERAI